MAKYEIVTYGEAKVLLEGRVYTLSELEEIVVYLKKINDHALRAIKESCDDT